MQTTGWTETRTLRSRIPSVERRPQYQDTPQLCMMLFRARRLHTTTTWSRRAATGLAGTSPNNIWCYLINKTFKQLNAERAHRRARQDAAQYGLKLRLKKKKIKLKKLVRKLNKENAPPDGWRPEDQVPSSQAGGPAHKESGSKQPD